MVLRVHRLTLPLLCLCLLNGCQPSEEPVPPTIPPPEDLSTWTVPELVQPESTKPKAQALWPAKAARRGIRESV